MARCEQELCENWTGDGDVCACRMLDLPPRTCPECGQSCGLEHDPWDGWSCDVCDWQENPL